jgi:hypothetical protein
MLMSVMAMCVQAQMVWAQVAAQGTKRTAIRAGKLIDGKGGPPVTNALIVIEGNKIMSVT